MGNIWVHAETSDGIVSSITLELLAKARELGEVTVFHAGADADQAAGELGQHGATRILTTGDLDNGLPGPALAAAVVPKPPKSHLQQYCLEPHTADAMSLGDFQSKWMHL